MKAKPSLEEVKLDLLPLKKYNVVLYGSYTTSYFTERSDIDVAVLTRETKPERNKKIWLSLLGRVPQKYDVKVFELLPLAIKASIIKKYIVVFGDQLDISEYFYHFRKLWKDVKKRYEENQFVSIQEMLKKKR